MNDVRRPRRRAGTHGVSARQVCRGDGRLLLDAGCDVVGGGRPDDQPDRPGPVPGVRHRRYITPVFDAHPPARCARLVLRLRARPAEHRGDVRDCGPDNISVDENIPLDYVRDVCLPREISFGGNMQLDHRTAAGQPEDVGAQCARRAWEPVAPGLRPRARAAICHTRRPRRTSKPSAETGARPLPARRAQGHGGHGYPEGSRWT